MKLVWSGYIDYPNCASAAGHLYKTISLLQNMKRKIHFSTFTGVINLFTQTFQHYSYSYCIVRICKGHFCQRQTKTDRQT